MVRGNRPNPRQANGHRRRKVRARVLREEDICYLCGEPVDKTLPPYLPGSPEVHEIEAVSLGGSPFDRANCRLTHRSCNVKHGNGTRPAAPKPEPVVSTRRWWGGSPSG